MEHRCLAEVTHEHSDVPMETLRVTQLLCYPQPGPWERVTVLSGDINRKDVNAADTAVVVTKAALFQSRKTTSICMYLYLFKIVN